MTSPALAVALYARVSSDQQAKDHTIDSQMHALRQRLADDGHTLPDHLAFVDDGYSGTTLLRPALERLRDQVAAGTIDRLYVLAPDRLARKYAYQVLLLEEFRRGGVEVVFLQQALGTSPEQDLLVQVQGMIAEYERAKILERSRRGKLQAARRGSVNVLHSAPYGYRYLDRHHGQGAAALVIHESEAQVVRELFRWVAEEQCTLGQICVRLQQAGVPSPRGKTTWSRSTVAGLLRNSTYQGLAMYGKTRVCERPPRVRPRKGQPEQPRRATVSRPTPPAEQIAIATPALVSAEVFARVAEQLRENQRRQRLGRRGATYLLQGLVVCASCGHAFYGKPVTSVYKGRHHRYTYYRCVGCEPYRYGGEKLCTNRQVRTDKLEEAVWADVCALLGDPARLEREVTQRLAPRPANDRERQRVEAEVGRTKAGLARVIDGYENGLLERSDFAERTQRLRGRLGELEAKLAAGVKAQAAVLEAEAVVAALQAFADRVRNGLADANWQTRRDILRALVKRVEIDTEEVRIVFRIPPQPFIDAPGAGSLPNCTGSVHSGLPTK
jgi:site-specific DNA recombinase